jgi:hypothetical protein
MVRYITAIRVLLMLIIVLVSSVYLPDFFWKANKHENKKINVFYSPILKDFVFIKADVRQTYYADTKGKYYTRDEFEPLLPFLNFRQLMLAGKLPDVIDGVPIRPKEVSLNNINMRVQPAIIQYKPLQLFPLFESASGRLRLELPPDFFRIRSRMEFITSITNEINEEKSSLFTAALVKEGFSFPAKAIYGNPSTKKPFDEGYFVIDDKGKVFHIKMVKGRPFCKDTGIPADLDIVYMVTTENELREFYALAVTKKNEVFIVSYDKYSLIQIPVEEYDYKENTLLIKGDLFYRVITVNQENGYHSIVTNRKYQIISRTGESWSGSEATNAGIIASCLFPFTVQIEKDTTPYIDFYVQYSDFRALFASNIALLFAMYYFRKKRIPIRQAALYCTVVILTGVYGLIALLTVKDFDDDPGKS